MVTLATSSLYYCLPPLQTQMANWNKMVAYINFALLIFLLLLIIVVVLGMNYYYLSHNMGVPQQSPGFLTPMA